MTFRWVNAVRPDLPGKPESTLKVELADLAEAGAAETLMTPLLGSAWLRLFSDALIDHEHNWMIWAENGLGVGKELRRAFSAILGRFMARAYLERRHGITDFVPISSDATAHLGVTVSRSKTGIGLPDWIAAGPGSTIVLAEAKGNHSRSQNAPRGWSDTGGGPISGAVNQLRNTVVRSPSGAVVGATKWAVASRWACENGPTLPFLVAWDPDQPGTASDEERIVLKGRLRAYATARLLAGMGFQAVGVDVLRGNYAPDRWGGRVRLRERGRPTEGATYAVAIGGFGVLNLADANLAMLRQISERSRAPVYVFGLTDEEVAAAAARKPRGSPEPDSDAAEAEDFQSKVLEADLVLLKSIGARERQPAPLEAFPTDSAPAAKDVVVRRSLGERSNERLSHMNYKPNAGQYFLELAEVELIERG
jgi:hypothetical protein